MVPYLGHSVARLTPVWLLCPQEFVEDGLHSAHLIKGYRTACNLVREVTNARIGHAAD